MACAGNGAKTGTTPITSTRAEAPFAGFTELLDALNRQDYAAVYARLSTEARRSLSPDDVQALVRQLAAADAHFHIGIDQVRNQTESGDQAQLGLTLRIDYQGHQFPLTDVAFLVREGGQWRLSDHFLQTALAAAGRGAPPSQPRVIGADGCAGGDVLNGVYLPSRLQVYEPCVTIEGVVRAVEPNAAGEGDGDLSFNIEVQGNDLRLINDVNRRNMHGWLHLEIVPLDQPRLPTPHVGDRVRATGPWVLDTVHGHNELHPVWALVVLPP
jgi:hypothetical protein